MLKYTRCTGVLPVIHFSFSNGKLLCMPRFSMVINSKIELRKSLPTNRVRYRPSISGHISQALGRIITSGTTFIILTYRQLSIHALKYIQI